MDSGHLNVAIRKRQGFPVLGTGPGDMVALELHEQQTTRKAGPFTSFSCQKLVYKRDVISDLTCSVER